MLDSIRESTQKEEKKDNSNFANILTFYEWEKKSVQRFFVVVVVQVADV